MRNKIGPMKKPHRPCEAVGFEGLFNLQQASSLLGVQNQCCRPMAVVVICWPLAAVLDW